MHSNFARKGMVVTPHHLASQSAIAILKEGGTAIEAMVAGAATIAVVYPHMNGIGGDGFWLIIPPHGKPIAIEACGAAGSLATPEFFKGLTNIPYKGTKSAVTVPGTVGGWEEALKLVSEYGYRRISLQRLLADAIGYADVGVAVTQSQKTSTEKVENKTRSIEFTKIFLPNGKAPNVGELLYQKQMANTLKKLVANGLKDFYRGDVAKLILKDMISLGLPFTESDLAKYRPVRKEPLRLLHSHGEIYNLPPPTQGAVSLGILGVLDNLHIDGKDEARFVHATVEATKQAFKLRDEYITDPCEMNIDPNSLISSDTLLKMSNNINFNKASTFAKGKGPADTVWMGVMDKWGFSVSFIQSIYHEFGSGVVLPNTGILLQNRGVAFTLERNHILTIHPGKKPFHTLNPAAAKLHDGRIMVYGTQGGDGQPQTQTAIFHRYVVQNIDLQTSVSKPRWLFGRREGDHNNLLHLEGRFCDETMEFLRQRGHQVVKVADYSELMGQAGIIVRHANGSMEGAYDPRSIGSAVGF